MSDELLQMPALTADEIAAVQGTRKQEAQPWETYDESFNERLGASLEAAIEEYSKVDRVESKDSQTLETLAEQKELADAASREYQFVTPDEYEDRGARIGRIIHSSHFIEILQQNCGLTCWYRNILNLVRSRSLWIERTASPIQRPLVGFRVGSCQSSP